MASTRTIASAAALALSVAGCAAVSTRVTLLEPQHTAAPTQHVSILLEPAARPHWTLALIEAQGAVGGTEGELLEAARQEAARIGADAVVRVALDRVERPPVDIYDPVFSPFYSRYALRAGAFVYPPYLGHYRRVGGGTALTLKALAIRYRVTD